MKLLISADLHLGKRPSQIPESYATAFSASKIWEKIIALAIEQKVDIVLLAGDLIDAGNKFFESLGALEKGLARLSAAGITTYACTGNHDYDVLPQIAKNLKMNDFHLLGVNGKWEKTIFTKNNTPLLQVLGWSFPQRYFDASPIKFLTPDLLSPSLPAIALLHGDVYGSSLYAPMTKEELASIPIDLWVIGHYHLGLQSAMHHLLLPGAPQGMDSGTSECGIHSPWIIEIEQGKFSYKQVPIAPLIFDELHFALDQINDESSLKEKLWENILEHCNTLKQKAPALSFISLKITLEGFSSLTTTEVQKTVQELKETILSAKNLEIFISEIVVSALPKIDLKELIQKENLLSSLAKIIDDKNCPADLLQELEQKIVSAKKSPIFSSLDLKAVSCKKLLQEGAKKLLEELFLQGNSHD